MEIKKYQSKDLSIDVLLTFHKRTLDYCVTKLNCKECSSTSYVIGLLIMICEKLLASPHLMFLSHSESTASGEECQENGTGVPRTNLPQNNAPRIFLGEYEVESSDEIAQMVTVMKSNLSKRMSDILGRVEEISLANGWQTQLIMVKTLKSKT